MAAVFCTGRPQVSDMNVPNQTAPNPSLVSYTHWMYALHALSAAIGVLGAATVVGSFVMGIPSIIAVIMNYARRGEARGTWLESHFSWQLRTFWWAAALVIALFLLSLPLFFVLIGFVTFPFGMVVIGAWIIYRVVKGWLRLRDSQPI
jgi:uncharacterized membrane protein